MLHKIDLGDEKVVAFRWEGKFDERGFTQSLREFLPELKAHSKMNLYLEIASLTEVEAKAVWSELKFELQNSKELINKIDKAAIVTDMGWIRNMVPASSLVVPTMKIKAFEIKEAEAAKEWVK